MLSDETLKQVLRLNAQHLLRYLGGDPDDKLSVDFITNELIHTYRKGYRKGKQDESY